MRPRDWAGTVLVTVLVTTATLLRSHATALVVLLVVAVACVAFLAWDIWIRQSLSDRRARKSGAEVRRLKVTLTKKGNTTTTEWPDGRQDIKVQAPGALGVGYSGHAEARQKPAPWWKRLLLRARSAISR